MKFLSRYSVLEITVPFVVCLLREVADEREESFLDLVVFLASSYAGRDFLENRHMNLMKQRIPLAYGPFALSRGEMPQQYGNGIDALVLATAEELIRFAWLCDESLTDGRRESDSENRIMCNPRCVLRCRTLVIIYVMEDDVDFVSPLGRLVAAEGTEVALTLATLRWFPSDGCEATNGQEEAIDSVLHILRLLPQPLPPVDGLLDRPMYLGDQLHEFMRLWNVATGLSLYGIDQLHFLGCFNTILLLRQHLEVPALVEARLDRTPVVEGVAERLVLGGESEKDLTKDGRRQHMVSGHGAIDDFPLFLDHLQQKDSSI